jgi:cell wall-associated NlpC family hydrolase
LEFIALPGTVFRTVAPATGTTGVLQVTTDDYQAPAGTSLYVDGTLLEPHQTAAVPRKALLPSRESLQTMLRSAVGLPYIWGGNLREGVQSGKQRQFAGLDCSGLLYEATDGYTPRNTEQLVQFGSSVAIEGLGVEKLAKQLRPLDLIVWKGHVIIVMDHKTTIESVMNCGEKKNGVMLTPLKVRLEQLMQQRKPVNCWPADTKKAALFVVRRWL